MNQLNYVEVLRKLQDVALDVYGTDNSELEEKLNDCMRICAKRISVLYDTEK